MRIYVSGSLAYDRIMDFPERFSDHILPDKIHVLNVCFLVNSMREMYGGTAGNIAYNLSLLGEKPMILAAAGKDFHNYAEWLTGLGLPLDGIRTVDEELTAGAYITTDVADNQITGFNPGAMKMPCGYGLDGIDPNDTIGIVSPGNVEDMINYSRIYKKRRITHIFDPGQQIPIIPRDELVKMIAGADILVSNDYELEMIMRNTGMERERILETVGAVITTLGEKGCVVAGKDGSEEVPAAKADTVNDPTGAGDSFRAGLIKGMVMGKSIADAARMGAVCASFSVECHGTQCHRFTPEKFQARYEEHFGPLV